MRASRVFHQAITCATRDSAQRCWFPQSGEGQEFPDIYFGGASRSRISDVGEPFELRGNVGKVAVLSRR